MTVYPLSLILAVLLAVPGENEAADDSLGAAIDAFVAPLVARQHLSGNLLVARRGEIVCERSFGFSNHEHQVPNRPDTRFNIASITKPMTQVLVALLAQEALLNPDSVLSDWIEDFPGGDDITIMMLIMHTAGIPHRVTEPEQETAPMSAAEVVALARQRSLDFEPGQRRAYSSGGYSVLARVIEIADEQSYGEALALRVLVPAGMSSTAHLDHRTVLPKRASSYALEGDRITNTPLKDTSFLVGAGSVWSTARDLHRFFQALQGGTFGDLARENVIHSSSIGWNGASNGFRAFLDHDAATGLTVIFTGNLRTGAVDMMRAAIPRLAASEELPVPEVPEPVSVEVAEDLLRSYEGSYQVRPGSTIELQVRNGRLYANEWHLLPTSESTFFTVQDYAEIEVIRDADGKLLRLDWNSHPCPRVSATGSG